MSNQKKRSPVQCCTKPCCTDTPITAIGTIAAVVVRPFQPGWSNAGNGDRYAAARGCRIFVFVEKLDATVEYTKEEQSWSVL